MRCSPLLVISLLMPLVGAFAQESPQLENAPKPGPPISGDQKTVPNVTYQIELVEFRIGGGPEPGITPEEILERLAKRGEASNVEVIQTFHLSAIAGEESMARIGVLTSITTGVQNVPAGFQGRAGPMPTIRNMQQVELITSLRVVANPKGDKISARVSYSASRLEGEKPDDHSPDIASFTIESQILVNSGQRVLLGGTHSNSSNYAAITVTQR
jgi:hypothetical protein